MTDSPLHALRQCIANLNEAEAKKARPKKVTLASIPRQLALRVVGDYAADTKRTMADGLVAALSHKGRRELLLVIDGIPVIAMLMDVPLFAAWTWPGNPVGQALREIEEHPEHPGLPWFPGLEDRPKEEMMQWTVSAFKQASALTWTKAAPSSLPALALMPEGWQEWGKEDPDDGIKRETLSEDPAIALQQFKDSALERRDEILRELEKPNGFGVGVRGSEEFIAQVREWMAHEFDCHTEQATSGDLTVVHLSKRTVTLN